ncbi:hypothetical protein [Lactiplantibacillus plantarum]|uniref:hypothetical protein n=1 Tax=Lactiplantibacillus plantarum TaxID=1590 RepID=UPI00218230D9|nr:hypothetical protein [Lactiplantibacillus plantarum]MCT0195553.1 hypothetical protein [Lactiplantibacillus plantarum]
MKRWILRVALLIGIIITLLGFRWPTSTIEISQVDQLGTKITPNKHIKGRVGLKIAPHDLSLSGYKMVSNKKVIFKSQGYAIKIVYKPMDSKKKILKQMKNYRYIGASFQVLNTGLGTNTQNYNKIGPEEDRLRLILSNDGIRWKTMTINYPNVKVRDPDITRIGNKWWIVYTTGAMWTTDFQTWHHKFWNFDTKHKLRSVWAPEFYHDKNNHWYIIVAASADNVNYRLFRYRFNPSLETISGPEAIEIANSNGHVNLIDPHIDFHNNRFELLAKDEQHHYIVSAVSSDGYRFTHFQRLSLGMKTGLIPEGIERIYTSRTHSLVYFDQYNLSETFSGVHVVKFVGNKRVSNPIRLKANFLIRHFSIFDLKR